MSITRFMHLSVAGAGALLGYLIGDYDGFLRALVLFTVLDYITGVMRAIIIQKKLSSEVGFKGICKKVLIFIMVSVGNIVDQWLFSSGGVLRTAVIFFYLSNEGVSLLENATAIGLPVPKQLQNILVQLHNRSEADVTEKPLEIKPPEEK